MTIVSERAEIETNEFEQKGLKTTLLTAHDPHFNEWLNVRHDFMVQKGWRSEEDSELDIYDDDAITAQIAMFNAQGELAFGMRLTPVTDLSNSLSWEMVRDSTIHAQAYVTADGMPKEQLWDLTRLVPGKHLSSQERAEVIPKLFHEGLEYCRAQGDDNPVWFFALDKLTNIWLKRQGVAVEILGKGTIGDDTEETFFGYVLPAEIDQDMSAPSADFARHSRSENDDVY